MKEKNLKGIKRKDFDAYTAEMWERLKFGEKKYGCQYDEGDLAISMKEEALDLSNYAFMIFLKAREFARKLDK